MPGEHVPRRHEIKRPRGAPAHFHHHLPIARVAVVRADQGGVGRVQRRQALHAVYPHLRDGVVVVQPAAVDGAHQAHPEPAGPRRPEPGHLAGDDAIAHGAIVLVTCPLSLVTCTKTTSDQ